MKLNVAFFASILILFQSCIKYDGTIDSKYLKLIKNYRVNDTIYFKSNQNDLDTIRIVSIDSISIKDHGPDNTPSKTISVTIEHLPYNKWHSYDNGEIEFEEFIAIHKTQINNNHKDDTYSVYLRYRDFFEEFENHNQTTAVIKSDDSKIINQNSVVELHWNEDIGISGYKKGDGQIYKIVDFPKLNY